MIKKIPVKIKEKNLEPTFNEFMKDIANYVKHKYNILMNWDSEVIFTTAVLYAHFDLNAFKELYKTFLKNPNYLVCDDIDSELVQILLEALYSYQSALGLSDYYQ